MTDYNYEETEFVGVGGVISNVNIEGLQQQVLASTITSAGLSYINIEGASVIFTFDQPLSTGSPNDVIALNNIVTAHDGTHILQATGDTILSYSFADQDGTPLKTLNPTFTRSATVVFEGSDFYEAMPAKAQVSAYTDGSTIGEVRLYDLDNDIIIGTITINSLSEEIVEMDITGEWPEDKATIELQMRKVSGGEAEKLSITSLQIIF